MKAEGLRKIMGSPQLTDAEKSYIFDVHWGHWGSFKLALFEAIARADRANAARLSLGFPDEVAAYRAWTEGDLFERASKIAGGDCTFIEKEESNA